MVNKAVLQAGNCHFAFDSLQTKKTTNLLLNILFCSRLSVAAEDKARVYALIEKYNIHSHLFHRRNKTFLMCIPREKRLECKSKFLSNLEKITKQKQIAIKILEAFEKNEIAGIVLKGPFLSERIYGVEGVRLCGCDLDIMIKPQDYCSAKRVIESFGYKVFHQTKTLWGRDKIFGQTHCVNEDKRYPIIDLHLKPLCGAFIPDLKIEKYWSDAHKREIEGGEFYKFTDEILFIYLCFLIYKEIDEKKRLRYLLDFLFFIKNKKGILDYEKITRLIKEEKIDGYIVFCLDLITEYYPDSVKYTQDVFARLKPRPIRRIILKNAIGWFWVFEKCDLRWKKYGARVAAFSGGHMSGLLFQIKKIYSLSYLDFCARQNMPENFKSKIKHLLYFKRRAFSRVSREMAVVK